MDYSRDVLKGDVWETFSSTDNDRSKGLPAPPLQKSYPKDAQLIDLVPPDRFTVGKMPLIEAMAARKSRRKYTGESLSMEELSFLLWATQGVRWAGQRLKRTVPSAGSRHSFETYILVNHVDGLKPGLYRYLSMEHKLLWLKGDPDFVTRIDEAAHHQFVTQSAVVLIWAAIPYRTEYVYFRASPKLIALDAGHVGQNLYLAAESLGVGTVVIAAYHQKKMDAALELDGEDEFSVYLATVGRVKKKD